MERRYMKLEIENFAKIKSANVEINGITVIAGENNTGKSTIGKIMYCLYSAFHNFDLKIERERKRTIAGILLTNIIREGRHTIEDLSKEILKVVDELMKIENVQLNKIKKLIPYDISDEGLNELYNTLYFRSDELGSLIIKKCFSNEFKGQYLPVYKQSEDTFLQLCIQNKKNKIVFNGNEINVNIELEIVKECIYIDNPFTLGEIEETNKKNFFSVIDIVFGDSPIFDHKEHLKRKLSKSLKDHCADDLILEALLDKRLSHFKNMIKDVVKGDFLEKDNRFVFLEDETNSEIELENLSTGVKSLAILLKLIENRDITDKSMIVLDEPEIHLHPKWQLKFAEVLILLQAEFKLNIVLTSHSPYFISAIQAYAKKHNIEAVCKYYLTDLDESNKSIFEDVTSNTGKIFDKLSEPFDILDSIQFGDTYEI